MIDEEVNAVQTRSKNTPASTSTQAPPIPSKNNSSREQSKTLVVLDQLDYGIVEDLKKTGENI